MKSLAEPLTKKTMTNEEIPTINITIEEKTVEGKIIKIPYILVETPYVIYSDKDGTRKIWIKSKKKDCFILSFPNNRN